MKKIFFYFFLGTLFCLSLTSSAFARSGCCSYHGGVRSDGCGCNDGSPLSSTCAPYYTCITQENTTSATNDNYVAPIYIPTYTPVPTETLTPLPTATPTPKSTITLMPTKHIVRKAMKKVNEPNRVKHKNFWQRIFRW